jgi:nucleoporin POM152
VDQRGKYELVSVRDRFCPGVVSHNDYTVDWIPRPTLALDHRAGEVVKNGSIVRPPVCQGTRDSFDLLLQGQPPFVVSYDVISRRKGQTEERQQDALQLVQSRAPFPLSTAGAGHYAYHFTGIGDALYSRPDPAGLVGLSSQHADLVRVEQDVLALPVARIEQERDRVYCVHSALASRAGADLVVRLQGQPPFDIEMSVEEEGSHAAQLFPVEGIQGHSWPVTLPYVFEAAGPHRVSVRKVRDANGCESRLPRTDGVTSNGRGAAAAASRSIKVAEIASIAAVQPQKDHCVGESIDFVLQGAAPWKVDYAFGGERHSARTDEPRLSRVAKAPGRLTVVSVSHGDGACESTAVEIDKVIHPLPTVRVSQGRTLVEDIVEGEQAEIVFFFEGTPPFAFTYTRSDPTSRKVLETHTVTCVCFPSFLFPFTLADRPFQGRDGAQLHGVRFGRRDVRGHVCL